MWAFCKVLVPAEGTSGSLAVGGLDVTDPPHETPSRVPLTGTAGSISQDLWLLRKLIQDPLFPT